MTSTSAVNTILTSSSSKIFTPNKEFVNYFQGQTIKLSRSFAKDTDNIPKFVAVTLLMK